MMIADATAVIKSSSFATDDEVRFEEVHIDTDPQYVKDALKWAMLHVKSPGGRIIIQDYGNADIAVADMELTPSLNTGKIVIIEV